MGDMCRGSKGQGGGVTGLLVTSIGMGDVKSGGF